MTHPPPPAGRTEMTPSEAPGSGCGAGAGGTAAACDEALVAMKIVPLRDGSMPLPSEPSPKAIAAIAEHHATAAAHRLLVTISTLVGSCPLTDVITHLVIHQVNPSNELRCVAWLINSPAPAASPLGRQFQAVRTSAGAAPSTRRLCAESRANHCNGCCATTFSSPRNTAG